ncbi:MAG: hypothetical protein L3J76_01265 [Candidatus Hydrothermae bacterium]|nr:hypothetical protein [Candidatus Hydrothermae bacterium]
MGPLELEGHTLERAAILVEATLPSLELSGYLQLDLGIPRTVLYAKAFQEGELEAYILTRKAPMLGRERPVLNLPVQIGSLVLTSPLLLEEQESGEHNGRPILGSLGADALNQRVLILDFPRQRLAFLEAFPDSLKARGFFAPMETDPAGRPVLYAVHRGEKVRLLYDTGSSAFGLLTSRDRWEQLTTVRWWTRWMFPPGETWSGYTEGTCGIRFRWVPWSFRWTVCTSWTCPA